MYKIIIVDDEKLLRQGFIHMTNWMEHGFLIAGQASNGQEALEIIEKHQPHIVVTDIRMPVMNGVELTRTIKERFRHIEVIVMSSYNDFEYVKETLKLGALDYLLKQEMDARELLNVFEKAKLKLVKQDIKTHQEVETVRKNTITSFLCNLVTNHNPDPLLTREYFYRLGIQLCEENLVLLLWYFDTGARNEADNTSADAKDTFSPIIKHLEKIFDETLSIYFFIFNNRTVAALLNASPARLPKIHDQCTTSIGILHGDYNINLWCIAGKPFNRYTNICREFQALYKLTPYCFYIAENSLIPHDLIKEEFCVLDISYKPLNRFAESLNFDLIKREAVNVITGLISTHTYPQPFIVKKYLVEICYLILHKLHETGLMNDNISKSRFKYFMSIENAPTIGSLLEVFEHTVNEMQQVAQSHTERGYSPVIRRVIEYIHMHFPEDITLHSVAEHFNINKSYLCDLFKQQTGENFNDYVANVRVNKSKELLKIPENNIFSVSEQIGFSNASYFGRVFKGIVGMTPTDYIKLYRGRQQEG